MSGVHFDSTQSNSLNISNVLYFCNNDKIVYRDTLCNKKHEPGQHSHCSSHVSSLYNKYETCDVLNAAKIYDLHNTDNCDLYSDCSLRCLRSYDTSNHLESEIDLQTNSEVKKTSFVQS